MTPELGPAEERTRSDPESPRAGDTGSRPLQDVETTPSSGRRQVFRDLRRQLSDEDLASPGVQKLLLDNLETAESKCEALSGYVDRYHEADKQVGILTEKAKVRTALEVAFGVGLGLGGAIVGLAPLFWDQQPRGWLAIVIGLLLMIGAAIARVVAP